MGKAYDDWLKKGGAGNKDFEEYLKKKKLEKKKQLLLSMMYKDMVRTFLSLLTQSYYFDFYHCH